MPFEMSLKAITEEELMEVASLCSNMVDQIEAVFSDLRENEKLDRKNDRIRAEVTRHLSSALREHSRSRFDEVNTHVHAAQQRINDQEQVDISDDHPRIEAMMKLSVLKGKLDVNERRFKDLLKKLNTVK